MTANGPSSEDKRIKINVPSFGIEADPYVLPSTPSVVSVGYRCMEQGFDFIWKAYFRPDIRDKKGDKIFLAVKDIVLYLKSWPGISQSQLVQGKLCRRLGGLPHWTLRHLLPSS